MFLTILMLSSTLLTIVPPQVEGQSVTPDFTLEVSPGSITLDVSPRGTGVGVTTVTVTSQSTHTITVQVTINLPGYTVSPPVSTITLGPGASSTINVAVAALLRTPYKQSQGAIHGEVIRVDGVAVSAGYSADTGFIVTSLSYGKVILESDKPFQKVQPGKEYPFKIKVKNNGNAIDTYAMSITNKDKLQDKGFSITLSATRTTDVPMGDFVTITINIQTPRKFWRNEYYNIDIMGTSDVDPDEKTEYSITVWVFGVYVPGFEIAFSIISLAIMSAFMAQRRKR